MKRSRVPCKLHFISNPSSEKTSTNRDLARISKSPVLLNCGARPKLPKMAKMA